METIPIVLAKKLLLAIDRAARRAKQNRSALVRDALREHLRRLRLRDNEARDRLGYSAWSGIRDQTNACETEAAWPED